MQAEKKEKKEGHHLLAVSKNIWPSVAEHSRLSDNIYLAVSSPKNEYREY